MAEVGASGAPTAPAPDPAVVLQHGGRAVAEGIAPDSPAAEPILREIVGDLPVAERGRLANALATFTDARVERYWQLMGVLNGRPPFTPAVPAFDWTIAALRAN